MLKLKTTLTNSLVLTCVLITSHLSFAITQLKGTIKTSEEHKSLKVKQSESEANLETLNQNLNEEELYENAGVKASNMSERSFIFIQGSKFRLPQYRTRSQNKNSNQRHKTFFLELSDANFTKYDDLPPRFDSPPNIAPIPEAKKGHHMFDSSDRNINNILSDEMNFLSKKVNIANSVVELQYTDSKLKDSLVNIDSKYPDLMSSTFNGKYPKEIHKIKLKAIAVAQRTNTVTNKDMLLNREKIQVKLANNKSNEQFVSSTNPQQSVPLAVLTRVNERTPDGSDVPYNKNRFFGYMRRNDSFDDVKKGTNQTKSNTQEYREYIELLKQPLVRSGSLESNIDIKNNIFNRFKQTLVKNDQFQDIYPNHQNYEDYHVKMPYRRNNDMHLIKENVREDVYREEARHGEKASNKNIDYRQKDNNEDPEFRDSRIIKKHEEIKVIDAAISSPMESNEVYINNNAQNKNSRNVPNSPVDKSICVYPGCEYQNAAGQYYKSSSGNTCKCPSAKENAALISPKTFRISGEVMPVDISTIRQFGH